MIESKRPILMVERNPFLRNMYADLLADYDVVTIGTGEEGLRLPKHCHDKGIN